jgi:uncharacterized protein
MQIDFPFHTDNRGRTGSTDADDHVRDLIEQVLFTTPGERVNRPELGSGLLQLVFAPAGPELAATTRFLVQGALQQWLADVVEVEGVEVEVGEGRVEVLVQYVIRRTQERQVARFSRPA